jgi:hypothetical protein
VSFHFTRVSVDGDLLSLEMERADGTIGDTLEVSRTRSRPGHGDARIDSANDAEKPTRREPSTSSVPTSS